MVYMSKEKYMESSFCKFPLTELTELLASKAPVPGGGGAAALAGSLAAALGSMVCELTLGKKKYASYEERLREILSRAAALRTELLALIDADAKAFEPLSQAYAIPKDAPERAEIMEKALKAACEPPMEMARRCAETVELMSELAEKGSAIAVSDVGVGAQLARAALLSAGLNVRINARSMSDRDYAGALVRELDKLELSCVPLAEVTYAKVLARIG